MFDQIIPETVAWQDILRRGDVVLFRFPEVGSEPGVAKTRPCLVLEVERRDGHHSATLAYGTSARTAANRGYEIWVKRRTSMAVAGLNRATRFVGGRSISVQLVDGGFNLGLKGSPIIGHLDETLLERMHAVRARLQAEHDIAMAASEERHKERLRWQQEDAAIVRSRLQSSAWNDLRESVV